MQYDLLTAVEGVAISDNLAACCARLRVTVKTAADTSRRFKSRSVAATGTASCLVDGLASLRILQERRIEALTYDGEGNTSADFNTSADTQCNTPAPDGAASDHSDSSRVDVETESAVEADENEGQAEGATAADAERNDVDEEALAIWKEREEGGRKARMEELRVAMGVKDLKRRLLYAMDNKGDHREDEQSDGVTCARRKDARGTVIVFVAPDAVLRLGPLSRRRAGGIADRITGVKNRIPGPVQTHATKPSAKALRLAGRATHKFARSAQDYFTGGKTAPPYVFDYAAPFRRLHSWPLKERFEGIARPYRDAVIEGILYNWDEFSAMDDTLFNTTIRRLIENGSKGPWHSEETAVNADGGKDGLNRRGRERAPTKKRPAKSSRLAEGVDDGCEEGSEEGTVEDSGEGSESDASSDPDVAGPSTRWRKKGSGKGNKKRKKRKQ